MSEPITITFALLFYGLALAYQAFDFYRAKPVIKPVLVGLCAVGASFHLVGTLMLMFDSDGLNFGIFRSGSLVLAVTAILLAISCIKKPLHNLFFFILPLSIVSILLAQFWDADLSLIPPKFTLGMSIHILLSVGAYGIFILAAANALLLTWENQQLKQKNLGGRTRSLPPLETLETLLFQLIWVGEILLTTAILTGFLVFEDLFAQHLIHKTVFALLAWLAYAFLLIGRHRLGWRGATAIRWSLVGFAALVLAYTGTKFVLELILHQTTR